MFSKNRERLLSGPIAIPFFGHILEQARVREFSRREAQQRHPPIDDRPGRTAGAQEFRSRIDLGITPEIKEDHGVYLGHQLNVLKATPTFSTVCSGSNLKAFGENPC